MKRTGLLAVLLLSLIIILPLQGQDKSLRTENLFMHNFTSDDGLIESSVNSIFQDSRGYLWIGTDGGLDRFDGYTFHHYSIEESDSSLGNYNIIYSITEDSNGDLWVGTASGLCYLNVENNEFVRRKDVNNIIVSEVIFQESQNRLYFTSTEGMSFIDIESGELVKVPLKLEKQVQYITEVAIISTNELVLGTSNQGIVKVNTNTWEFSSWKVFDEDAFGSNFWVTNALKVENELYITTRGVGLLILDLETGALQELNTENSELPVNYIEDIDVIEDRVLLGTDGGGLVIMENKEIQSINQRNLLVNNGVPGNVIREVYVTKNGNICLGTFRFGFSVEDVSGQSVSYIKPMFSDQGVLKNTAVSSFSIDEEGKLMFGTDGEGVFSYDSGKIEYIPLNASSASREEKVVKLLKTKSGEIWVGTYLGGAYRWNGEEFENLPIGNNPANNSVWDIYELNDGNILLTSEVNLYVTTSDGIQPIFDDQTIKDNGIKFFRASVLDENNIIWAGSSHGLYHLKMDGEISQVLNNEEQTQFEGVSVTHILRDSKDKIWVGTYGYGLKVFDNYQQVFKEKLKPFDNSFIYGIIEDNQGNFWFSADDGIYHLSEDLQVLRHYTKGNGLQYNTSLLKSVFLYQDQVFFGGIEGIHVFLTNYNKSEIAKKGLGVSEVRYLDHFYSFWNQESPTESQVAFTYAETDLKINLSNLGYFDNPNSTYRVKLQGYDTEWTTPAVESQLVYNNLPVGSYELLYQVEDYNDTEVSRLLTIEILPQWWMTWYFYSVIGILFIVLIMGANYYRTRYLVKSKKILETRVNEKTQLIEKQKSELIEKNAEINEQYDNLKTQNNELLVLNKELKKQRELIRIQQLELQIVNENLESKVKDRTKELNNTIEQLNKTISELDRFVYSASHDLSAPLKSILGLLNVIEVQVKDPVLDGYVNHIRITVGKLEEVIFSLMQFSRNSRTDVNKESFHIMEMIQSCIEEFRFSNHFEKIQLNIDIPMDQTIVTDKQRLKMILRNILSNAFKYVDESKAKSELSIKYSSTKSDWSLCFTDNGIGISKDHLSQVFNMFYRATLNSTGSGLGLYIVRESVNRLNGTIDIQSELGEGTEISLTFPKEQL